MTTDAVAAERTALRARMLLGARRPENWLQLLRFAIVGGSGYVLNLAVFAVAVHVAGLDPSPSAVLAFLVALANNFLWNRHWTFRATAGRPHHQAARFVVVSCGAFLVAFGLLHLLLALTAMPPVVAQGTSVLCAMPVNFLANRLWTFRS